MARITLGRQSVELSQIHEIRVVQPEFSRRVAGSVAVVASGALALLAREVVGLPALTAILLFAGSVVVGGALLGSAVSGQVCLDIEYQGGRVSRLDCISRLHAEQMKADLLRRMQEQ
ncbi:MAG: hypothetical protein O9333_10740 [Beijerinckiaceae bacterium]|jgi:hypothetical protein|nr:hypothetical protein [Beijerinckiaceae bacterium]